VELVAQRAVGAGGKKALLCVLDTNVALTQLDFLENQSGVLGVVVVAVRVSTRWGGGWAEGARVCVCVCVCVCACLGW
jgi:hypothetical protein